MPNSSIVHKSFCSLSFDPPVALSLTLKKNKNKTKQKQNENKTKTKTKRNKKNRPYTPTNVPGDRGVIDLVVKDYEGGKMSSAICRLQPGQTMEMKGPIPKVRRRKASTTTTTIPRKKKNSLSLISLFVRRRRSTTEHTRS